MSANPSGSATTSAFSRPSFREHHHGTSQKISVAWEEAWEYGEEVEENHISTVGHRVRPPWTTEERAAELER